MRYPHRVRIIDPRNRQPPPGVAYNAKAYDVIRTGGYTLTEFLPDPQAFVDGDYPERVRLVNKHLTEPEGSAPVFIDVQALVTTVDDGTRNINKEAFSVKVPRSEISKAGTYLATQREKSISDYGYQTVIDRSPFRLTSTSVTWRGNGAQSTITLFLSSEATPSSVISANPNTLKLTIAGAGDNSSPLDGKVLLNLIPWTKTQQTGTDFVLNGDFPPVIEWTAQEEVLGLPLRTQVQLGLNRNNSAYAKFGKNVLDVQTWGYDNYLKIDRVDEYPDMVDIRCSQEVGIL